MTMINMPGFTAEASLAALGGRFRVSFAAPLSGGAVIPQSCDADCQDLCGDPTDCAELPPPQAAQCRMQINACRNACCIADNCDQNCFHQCQSGCFRLPLSRRIACLDACRRQCCPPPPVCGPCMQTCTNANGTMFTRPC